MKTRIFELAPSHGYKNLTQLAGAMGVSVAAVSRLRAGLVDVSIEIVNGSRRAFPTVPLDELFPPNAEESKETAEIAGG